MELLYIHSVNNVMQLALLHTYNYVWSTLGWQAFAPNKLLNENDRWLKRTFPMQENNETKERKKKIKMLIYSMGQQNTYSNFVSELVDKPL